jgi:hypothetical protein
LDLGLLKEEVKLSTAMQPTTSESCVSGNILWYPTGKEPPTFGSFLVEQKDTTLQTTQGISVDGMNSTVGQKKVQASF